MSQKKRTNYEILDFLTKFVGWISTKLSNIQIVKLSSDHIKETEEEIKRIKQMIKITQAQIKKQQAILAGVTKTYKKSKATSLIVSSKKETLILPDVEVFQIKEEDEEFLGDDRNIWSLEE
jgi:menaquinone-dependent protoporphyrinogen IX oxidase